MHLLVKIDKDRSIGWEASMQRLADFWLGIFLLVENSCHIISNLLLLFHSSKT